MRLQFQKIPHYGPVLFRLLGVCHVPRAAYHTPLDLWDTVEERPYLVVFFVLAMEEKNGLFDEFALFRHVEC